MTDSNQMYYLYHIPGKKIGVTTDPRMRVEKQQGYKPNQYEILLTTEDVDEVSEKEIELQKRYNYPVDRKLYKNLKIDKMKINATEQTSTFPVAISDLKSYLEENKGQVWSTHLGDFELTDETSRWICANVYKSQYTKDRCFIYNKAFYEAFIAEPALETNDTVSMRDIFPLIRQWARERGIYDKGDKKTQYVKLMEEAGELAQALLKDKQEETIDAIGDMVVVLTNLSELVGVDIEDCILSAYNEIKDRKGKMSNGTFVKQL